MENNEIHNDSEHASVSLKVILLIFAVLLVGVLGYLVWDAQNTTNTTDYSTPVVTKEVETVKEETIKADETEEEIKVVSNVVKYSYDYKNTKLDIKFDLPDNYGASMVSTGGGVAQTTINIGKYSEKNGDNVILTGGGSVIFHVKIIPSFNGDVATLSDWQNYEGLNLNQSTSDLISEDNIKIDGVEAKKYRIGGFGEFNLIQFVKDKSFYEIRSEVGFYEEAFIKIVETFKFN